MLGFNISKHVQGVVFGILSALGVTGYIITNKYIYGQYEVTPFQYAVIFAVAGGIFSSISLAFHLDKSKIRNIKSDYKFLLMMGIIGPAAVAILVVGQSYTSSVNTALLITSSVLTTALFSRVLLNVLPSKNQWLWMIGLFAGIYLGIVGFSSLSLNSGDIIILSSALVFGLGNVLSKIAMKKHNPNTVADVRMIIGAIISIAAGVFILDDPRLYVDFAPLALLAGFFYWATMQSFAKAVDIVGANSAITLNQSQIFTTGILGALILSEIYNWENFAGSVLAIVSIYFITRARK